MQPGLDSDFFVAVLFCLRRSRPTHALPSPLLLANTAVAGAAGRWLADRGTPTLTLDKFARWRWGRTSTVGTLTSLEGGSVEMVRLFFIFLFYPNLTCAVLSLPVRAAGPRHGCGDASPTLASLLAGVATPTRRPRGRGLPLWRSSRQQLSIGRPATLLCRLNALRGAHHGRGDAQPTLASLEGATTSS